MHRCLQCGAARLIAVLALVVLATACEDYEYVPPSGTITYKEHIRADSGVECGYGYDWDGKYRYSCDPWFESECYLIEFTDSEWDYEDCTSKAVYDAVEVGDPYTEGQTAPG